jgi:hypothetical protein
LEEAIVETTNGIVSETLWLPRVTRRETAVVVWFVVILTVVAFPGKFLFYAAPFLAMGMMALPTPLASPWRFFILMVCLGGFGSLSVIFDFIDGSQVSWWGIVFGLYTYSMIVMGLSSSPAARISERTYERIAYICVHFMIIQALLGFMEFLTTHNADYVSGSFGLTDTVGGGHTISQVNFTFNIFMMILFCLPFISRPYVAFGVILGLIVCAIAQSGHQTIFFVATPLILGMSNPKYTKSVMLLALPIIFVVLNVVAFYPETLRVALSWFSKIVVDDHSLKRQIISASFGYLSEPKNFLLGMGLGQFTSRAAQIVAGDSITVPLPDFITGVSGYYEQSIRPLLVDYSHMGEGSAMTKPYFSILSIFTELGPLVGIAIIALVVTEIRNNIPPRRVTDRTAKAAGYYCNFMIVFIMLCSCIEDYLELTQAISIPVLLYLVSRGRLRSATSEVRRVSF